MKFSKQLLLMSAALILFVSCSGPKQQSQQESVERVDNVETTELKMTEISRVIEFSTTLQGYQSMSVSPSLTGTIEHIYVEVGKYVKKGDLLVRMDQNQLNNTRLTFANLQVELERMAALRESGAVSQQQYDQIKLSYDQTKASLDFLESNTFVRAQFPGVISAKNYEDGELYSGQPILSLVQIGVLKAYINVPESYFPHIKTGMKVNIISDIYPDEVFPATIEIIHPTIDPASHTFQVKLRIPNSSSKLRPGMYVKTELTMGKANTLVVPYQSVLKLLGSNERYLFVEENGVAKQVFVELGQRFDQNIEIFSDELKEGDKIVTVGQSKLINGGKLNVVKEN